MTKPITWKSLQDVLPADLSDDTIELVRRATAPYRHTDRVCATIKAALSYVSISTSPSRLECLHAAHVIELDRFGTGGILNAGGDATMRMTWARQLGTGRRQASDGSAWMAAAAEAQSVLFDVVRGIGVPPAWMCVYGDTIENASALDAGSLSCRVLGEIIPEDLCFARTFARSKIVKLSESLDGALRYMCEHRVPEIIAEIRAWNDTLVLIEKEAEKGNTKEL